MEKTRTESISIIDHFAAVDDPRMERTGKRRLGDIIAVAVCAVIADADSWTDIQTFGNAKLEWFKTFLELPNGLPSHDAFGRVFSLIDARRFQTLFVEWTRNAREAAQGQVVAIDGKTVRRSAKKAKGKCPIHMVSAWATANGAALGQVKTKAHSNEITAIPELLKMLELKGCIVTIDAMGCQKKIAKEIVGKGADYVLAVKKNRRWLREDVSEAFDYGERTAFAHMETDLFETVDKGHGRVERRRCWAARAPSAIGVEADGGDWANMRSVAMVESERRANGETTVNRRYFISSLPACAETILRSVRERWAEKSLKIGVAARRKKAGWDLEYLCSVLGVQMK